MGSRSVQGISWHNKNTEVIGYHEVKFIHLSHPFGFEVYSFELSFWTWVLYRISDDTTKKMKSKGITHDWSKNFSSEYPFWAWVLYWVSDDKKKEVLQLSSICYRIHAVCNTFHFPHCSFFDFLSILLMSFPFECICLLYFNFSFPFRWLSHLGWLEKVNKIMVLNVLLVIWIVSLSMILK